jgi:excisionase family DNA binding protein
MSITGNSGETIMDPLAYSIPEVCELARAGRTALYQAINSGELVAHKRGKRTLIFARDLQRYLDALPQIEVKHPIERAAVSSTAQATSRAPTERKEIK